MRKRWGHKHLLAGLLLALFGLAGCGGGNAPEPLSAAIAAPVLKVEAFTQADSTQDVSPIKSRHLSRNAEIVPSHVDLGPLDATKSAGEPLPGARLIGVARTVEATSSAAALASILRWEPTAEGGQRAAVSISAQDAHGLRLGLWVEALPGSALLRVYSQDKPDTVYEISGQQVLQSIERNVAAGDSSDAAHTWWTPELGASEQTLEIELPRGTDPRALRIALPQVSHIFEDLSIQNEGALQSKINESDPCNLDASCHDDVASLRDAVARMVFTKSGLTYACTGTLLNDSNSSGTPYFLSANHCISSQTAASSLQTDWFYRSPTCNSRTLSTTSARRLGGATLLYASAVTDTALLRLADAPPVGAVFAAWDASTQAPGSAIVGLHHPRADLLKVSYGSISSQADCASTSETQFSCTGSSGNYYRVRWTSGTTESGSSGSALFRGGYVVGTLYGGNAACAIATSSDYYGRFDVAYAAGLKQWLGTAKVATRTPVYRFFNKRTGAHFYTASAGERDFVARTYPDFNYENIAFYAYGDASTGASPVFRFFSTTTGAHFYTISAGERDFVRSTYPAFSYEGPSWYAQTALGNGATPMYRFFNLRTGAHFYTISGAERDFVIASYPDFRYEGTAYYAWTTP